MWQFTVECLRPGRHHEQTHLAINRKHHAVPNILFVYISIMQIECHHLRGFLCIHSSHYLQPENTKMNVSESRKCHTLETLTLLLSHSVTTCLGAVAVCSNEGTAHIVHVFSDAVMGKISGLTNTSFRNQRLYEIDTT